MPNMLVQISAEMAKATEYFWGLLTLKAYNFAAL